MNDLKLIFQQETGQSKPRLKPHAGSSMPWAADELEILESDLTKKYQDLLRGKVPTVTFQDRPFRVTVQTDEHTRMPAVILTDASIPSQAEATSIAGSAWLNGLLSELDRLAIETTPSLEPLERSMLKCVADELRDLAGQVGAGGVAGLLIAGHLISAEHQARQTDPARAAIYELAQRGLDKLLARVSGDDSGATLARVGRNPNDVPTPRGAVARLLRRLFGRSGEQIAARS